MKRLNLSWPIIHIIGLPGAGKTTLAKKLSKRLKIPIVRIGEYRAKFPVSALGEADAWIALFCDLSRRKWKNCIFESTGLNCRESFLEKALPLGQMTIKQKQGTFSKLISGVSQNQSQMCPQLPQTCL